MKKLHIWLLKLRARWHVSSYASIREDYDCGEELAQAISKRLRHHAQKADAIMDKLREIDPEYPHDAPEPTRMMR